MNFAPGDVVVMRSGGVPMMVARVEGDQIAYEWRDKNKMYKEKFTDVVLKKYAQPKPITFSF